MGSLIGIGAGAPFGGGSGIPSDNLAAAFDAWSGITSSGGFASAWADRSGNGRNLLQASGAAQPIHLPAGVNTTGTAQAGSTGTTIVLATGALAVNDVYNQMTITLTGGTGAGQTRTITDYIGASRTATVAAWSVTPDNTTTYSISATYPSLFFNGSSHFMDTASFTVAQPFTVFMAMTQHTWVVNGTIFDRLTGGPASFAALYNTGSTPQILQFCTTNGASTSDMTLGTRRVLASMVNGVTSTLQAGTGSVGTGAPGVTGLDGITLASRNDQANYTNIQVNELLVYSAALSAAVRANIIQSLTSKWGAS
jgi:hypothetical protein